MVFTNYVGSFENRNFHEIEIRPASVRPSIHLWHLLSLKLLHGFLSNFSCGFLFIFLFFVFFFHFGNKLSSQWTSQNLKNPKLHLGFLKIEISMNLIRFSLAWDPMGIKVSKCYSYKSQPNVFKLVLNFPPSGPHKMTLGIFEILSFWFLTIFFRKFQIHHCTLWRNQKPQVCGKRAIVEQNGVKFWTR